MQEKCNGCEEKQACIPFFVHENSMMHYNLVNRRMLMIIVSILVFGSLVVGIFVYGNTVREKQLIDMINQRFAEVLADGVHEQPSP